MLYGLPVVICLAIFANFIPAPNRDKIIRHGVFRNPYGEITCPEPVIKTEVIEAAVLIFLHPSVRDIAVDA